MESRWEDKLSLLSFPGGIRGMFSPCTPFSGSHMVKVRPAE